MHASRRTRTSARTRWLTAAAVPLALLLAASWPAAAPAGAATTATFLYTGAQQQFVVPADVTSVHVVAVGGAGGSGFGPGGGAAGAPAEVTGDLEVFPGQALYVEVGGTGIGAEVFGTEAFNGGSFGGEGAGGGGGASDVRFISRPEHDTPFSLNSRLIVAAGGGGGGAGKEGVTGGAGGQAGSAGGAASAGPASGGGAGTEEAGGTGCAGSCSGKLGSGTQGNVGEAGSKGGGGGGGLFGGGGGASNGKTGGGGGGGGSSLQPPGGRTVVPAALSSPEVQITYTPPAPAPAPAPKPPVPPVPSNAFVLLRPIAGIGSSTTLVLDLPGAGAVNATATAVREVTVKRHGRRVHRRVRFTFAGAHATVTAAGALELTLEPSAAGRKALATHKRLAVGIAVTFAPTGGKAATKHQNVTVTRS